MSDDGKERIRRLLEMLGTETGKSDEELNEIYDTSLEAERKEGPSETELYHIYDQFTKFAILQLLKSFAVHNMKDKSDIFLNELVAIFIKQFKGNVYRKFERDELNLETNITASTAKGLLQKENDIVKERVLKSITSFEDYIKKSLDINESNLSQGDSDDTGFSDNLPDNFPDNLFPPDNNDEGLF